MNDDDRARAEFEAWVSAPPREKPIARYSTDPKRTIWPGQYKHYDTQLAWEAWEARQVRGGQIAAERAAVVHFICDHREWTTLRLIIAIGNGDHRRELDAAVRGIDADAQAEPVGGPSAVRSRLMRAASVIEALEQGEPR